MQLASLSSLMAGAALLAVSSLPAQGMPTLYKDLNTTLNPNSSFPFAARLGQGGTFGKGFIKCGAFWYFVATTAATGSELWRTNGTSAGTTLVKDLNPGTAGSSIREITCVGTKIFFSNFTSGTGATGRELYVSDGTSAGTKLVKDIRPGTSSGIGFSQSFVALGNKLFFNANDGTNGNELWESDGTAAGTKIVKNIRAGSLSGNPIFMRVWNNAIYFQANDGTNGSEIWKSDGTAANTAMLKNIRTGSGSSSPTYFVPLSATKMLFRASDTANGIELWETDGTAAGTKLLKNIRAGSTSSSPDLFYNAIVGGTLYFEANGGNGNELWKTDGTAAGTVEVKNIRAGTLGSNPTEFCAAGSKVFFEANDGTNGTEVWVTDGTSAGTMLTKNINPGSASSFPRVGAALGGNYYFEADDGTNGDELWVSDGTAAGTKLVVDANTGSGNSDPFDLTPISATRIIYGGRNTANGDELMITGGTAATTTTLRDINSGGSTTSASPGNLTCCPDGKTFYFSAFQNDVGNEPYFADAQGCFFLGDLNPGTSSSSPRNFTCCWDGKKVFTVFTAFRTGIGTELWVTDGTKPGTKLLKDIRPGSSSSSPFNFVCCGGKVFFRAFGPNGTELYVTDGVTVTEIDIRKGTSSSSPSNLTCCNGKLYFTANDGTNGIELWMSDGTAAGTKMVKDIRSGSSSSAPSFLVCCGDKLFFRASGTEGSELWESDGTASGTKLVKDIRSGSLSSFPSYLTKCGDKVYFMANDGTNGTELWVTDGTSAGTKMVANMNAGSASSSVFEIACCDGKLYFSNFISGTAGGGREPWVSDGTAAGTKRIVDLNPGSASSSPTQWTCAGKGVYFRASNGFSSTTTPPGAGTELWYTDGTAAGTKLVKDIYPGTLSSFPSNLMVCCGELYFTANDGKVGTEIWRIRAPGATAVKLGTGGPGSYSTLCSTAPILGGTATHTYSGGPASHIGVFVFSAPFGPASTFTFTGGLKAGTAAYVNLLNFGFLNATATSSGTFPLAIPNNTRLNGVKIHTQVFWVPTTGSILGGIEATNGVALRLGN